MPWKNPETRRAKRALRRSEIRANERAWYQRNKERVRAKVKVRRAARRKAKPEPTAEELAFREADRRAKVREKSRRARTLNPDKANARSKAWRQENPERMRALNRQAKIRSAHAKEAMAGRPRPSACEICGRSDGRPLHFDHCHQHGHFRGWICSQCNHALGLTGDNPDLLRKMIAYLERSPTG